MNGAVAGRRITCLSVYLLIAAALFLPSSASADPITVTPVRITGGSLVSDAEGRAQLIFAGTGGFGLSGAGSFRFFNRTTSASTPTHACPAIPSAWPATGMAPISMAR